VIGCGRSCQKSSHWASKTKRSAIRNLLDHYLPNPVARSEGAADACISASAYLNDLSLVDKMLGACVLASLGKTLPAKRSCMRPREWLARRSRFLAFSQTGSECLKRNLRSDTSPERDEVRIVAENTPEGVTELSPGLRPAIAGRNPGYGY